MPRSRSKKKTALPRRRVAVQDEDGWTHITNTRQVTSTATATATSTTTDQLLPAEIPDGLTLSQLRAQFESHRQKWLASQTWKTITSTNIDKAINKDITIDKFVCIALGSPSGFLRGGLIDRRAVSLFQLAAFTSLIEYLSRNSNSNNTRHHDEDEHEDDAADDDDTKRSRRAYRCYAQDPVFNRLDVELLASLGVEVVQREAFGMVDEQTVLFGPGMERRHLVELLARRPVVFFGGPLEGPSTSSSTTTSDVIEDFKEKHQSVRLPDFEPNTAPFWGTSIFWRDSHPAI
ncbi:hypothetical protein MGYG_03936 [Nannizzia gypsea CBS 118893]|uniref:SRR1-like domain-containing protein n=1 Tax=Arthroderma gypseum (strain ATCC MYA-4604 / CBS 118893) TaxID=535722 RepID=E4UUG8_ARTGP|nr:hypothetical protein MGYG_03936 [Nannizzia gypsea CBS 118893]EFR00935.1 hypothetical protein MGYG_03936 [Nannizzia gypsea CBS 118893]